MKTQILQFVIPVWSGEGDINYLGVVHARGFRVARKVTKAVTKEKMNQVMRNRHQCNLVVKYRGTIHIWNNVIIYRGRDSKRSINTFIDKATRHPAVLKLAISATVQRDIFKGHISYSVGSHLSVACLRRGWVCLCRLGLCSKQGKLRLAKALGLHVLSVLLYQNVCFWNQRLIYHVTNSNLSIWT